MELRPDLAEYLWDYLRVKDFPAAFPWEQQTARWKRIMLIISPIYQSYSQILMLRKQFNPFGDGSQKPDDR